MINENGKKVKEESGDSVLFENKFGSGSVCAALVYYYYCIKCFL